MLNPISSSQLSHASDSTKPAAPSPRQPQQKNAPQPSDTVTLKSANLDHDGDAH
ncbi:MAG: hypothetical protein WCB59_17785 [Candidatus Sulfotelmatobacter sp.]